MIPSVLRWWNYIGAGIPIVLTLAVATVGSSIAQLFLIGLIVWALTGPRQAFEALALSWLIASLNHDLFTSLDVIPASRWLLLGSAFLVALTTTLWRGGMPDRAIGPLMCYVILIVAFSLISSYNFQLSAFKLVAFFMGAFSVITLSNTLSMHREQRDRVERFFEIMLITVTVASLYLIRREVGYAVNGRGFQGILIHPQVYGTFSAVVSSLYLGRWLSERKVGVGSVGMSTVGLISLFASGARTGAVALVFGFTCVLIVGLIFRRDWLGQLGRRFSAMRIACGAVVVALTLGFTGNQIASYLTDFALKSTEPVSEGGGYSEALLETRSGSIAASWSNFLEHPWFGAGFGVASNPGQWRVEVDPFFGLPIGASTEKGFLPTAILEESGLVGAGVFIWLIIALAAPIVRYGTVVHFLVFATCLGVNLGESVLLSFGGHGLFVWLMIGLVRSLAVPAEARPRQDREEASVSEDGRSRARREWAMFGPGSPLRTLPLRD